MFDIDSRLSLTRETSDYRREDVSRELNTMLKQCLAKNKESTIREQKRIMLTSSYKDKSMKYRNHMADIDRQRLMRRHAKDVHWHKKMDEVDQANREFSRYLNKKQIKISDIDDRMEQIKEDRVKLHKNKEILKRMLADDYEQVKKGRMSEHQLKVKYSAIDDREFIDALAEGAQYKEPSILTFT